MKYLYKIKNCFFIIFVGYIHAMQSQIMSYDEYRKLPIKLPYSFSLSASANQHLFYFGSNHSYDPKNEQYVALENFWNEFLKKTNLENCVVLVEGCIRHNVNPDKIRAIFEDGGEGGFITCLASKNNISTECPEPDDQFLLQDLLINFSEEEVAYKIFAQTVCQSHRVKKSDPGFNFAEYMQPYFEHEKDCFTFPYTLEKMKEIHKVIFGRQINLDDEQFFYDITNPVVAKTIIRFC